MFIIILLINIILFRKYVLLGYGISYKMVSIKHDEKGNVKYIFKHLSYFQSF